MSHRTSSIHRTALSSVGIGIILALILKSDGACVLGLLSAQLLSMWFIALYRFLLPNIHRSAPGAYIQHNTEFMKKTAASAAPRIYVSRDPTVVYFGTLSVVLGLCDAFSAILPHTSADRFMLCIIGVLISRNYLRGIAVLSLMYCIATEPIPYAHEMLRVLCLALSVGCSHLGLSNWYTVVRTTVMIICVSLYCPMPCMSVMRAVPPVLLIQSALFSWSASLTVIVIIASILV